MENNVTCPCLICDLYLTKNNSSENCKKRQCDYDKKIARQIANEIYFVMHSFYCNECELHFNKEDYKFDPYCPNCGNSFR